VAILPVPSQSLAAPGLYPMVAIVTICAAARPACLAKFFFIARWGGNI
jgi:hypothetical protein